jgi:RNA methyltransferase, TrmH family
MNDTTITARSNRWVQQWLRYQNKPAERKAAGLAWLEGEHLVVEALTRLASNTYKIDAIVLPKTEYGLATFKRLSSQYGATRGLNIVWLGESVYKLLCTMESVPSVCAAVQLAPTVQADFNATTVVLDSVQDPGNVGTLIRLCAAFAVPQVLLSSGCANAWSSKALRAGQGAQLSVCVMEDVDLAAAYNGFSNHQLPIAVTSLGAGSTPLDQAPLEKAMVWVFGNEGQGVSEMTQFSATQLIHIPMQGGFESLNVGSAAAICLWQWQQLLAS